MVCTSSSSVRGQSKVLSGTYERSFDPLGRFVMPAAYRERFSYQRLWLVAGQLPARIEVWEEREFEPRVERLVRGLDEQRRDAEARQLLSQAFQSHVDKQNRVLIPAELRGLLRFGLDRVVILGVFDHLELWPPEDWQSNRLSTESVLRAALAEDHWDS